MGSKQRATQRVELDQTTKKHCMTFLISAIDAADVIEVTAASRR
jgi:hypothetical protein